MRILIADDHRLVSQGIEQFIADSGAGEVVGVAYTIKEIKEQLSALQPDVLLLDVAFPDGDGIDAIPELRKLCKSTRIVMLTMYGEPNVVRRAMEQKADGFVLKGNGKEELIEALKAIGEGEKFLSKEAKELLGKNEEMTATLSPREREILKLIADGKTTKEIADSLYLGFETVHSYTKYMRQKLGAVNSAAMIRIAKDQHLL